VLPDGLSPVLVEGRLGRDRLRREGDAFVTRRSGERFTRGQIEALAATAPAVQAAMQREFARQSLASDAWVVQLRSAGARVVG